MGDMSDLNKPGYRPKFLSEFSMGELEFMRYNEWLKYIEHWSAEINSTAAPTLEMIQRHFSGLTVLWKLWRPIVAVADIKQKVDDAMKEIKREKRMWEGSIQSGMPMNPARITQVVDNLDEVHTKLMEIKQVVGLGIVVRRNMSTTEKIKTGIGRIKSFEGLPEA